jgi:N-acetylmuramoyl-L-alanine amidase
MLNKLSVMRRLALSVLFITILSSAGLKADSVTVYFPNEPEKKHLVESIFLGRATYISAKDLGEALTSRIYENVDRGKMVIYFGGHRIKISANCGFVLVDDKAYQMPTHPIQVDEDIYLPMRMFLDIFNRHAAPGVAYDELRNVIVVEILSHNVTGIKIEEKSNGTVIRIQTTRQFDEGKMTAWAAQNGWFYLTVVGGVGDSVSIQNTQPMGIVLEAQMDQTGRTVQLAFRLRSNIESHDIHQNTAPNEIVLTLRSPLILSEEKMRRSRDYWYIDTIVLDAGHGGKDGGTTGKYGLQEKFVTLDITKRLGRLLEKHTNVKIIYTRDEDVFIPLWKRTKSANESNGKIVREHTCQCTQKSPNQRI